MHLYNDLQSFSNKWMLTSKQIVYNGYNNSFKKYRVEKCFFCNFLPGFPKISFSAKLKKIKLKLNLCLKKYKNIKNTQKI